MWIIMKIDRYDGNERYLHRETDEFTSVLSNARPFDSAMDAHAKARTFTNSDRFRVIWRGSAIHPLRRIREQSRRVHGGT
jgi:hypothetical protein